MKREGGRESERNKNSVNENEKEKENRSEWAKKNNWNKMMIRQVYMHSSVAHLDLCFLYVLSSLTYCCRWYLRFFLSRYSSYICHLPRDERWRWMLALVGMWAHINRISHFIWTNVRIMESSMNISDGIDDANCWIDMEHGTWNTEHTTKRNMEYLFHATIFRVCYANIEMLKLTGLMATECSKKKK